MVLASGRRTLDVKLFLTANGLLATLSAVYSLCVAFYRRRVATRLAHPPISFNRARFVVFLALHLNLPLWRRRSVRLGGRVRKTFGYVPVPAFICEQGGDCF